MLAARVFFGLACVNLALHLAEVPWLAKQANPVTPAGDLYYQLVRTRDELAAVREQNVMLREMLGAGPLDSEAKLMNKYRRLVDLQKAYVTKRLDPADADAADAGAGGAKSSATRPRDANGPDAPGSVDPSGPI